MSYKGQNLSLRDIFRRQNVTPPEGKSFFYKVKRQKTSKHQSCDADVSVKKGKRT